MFIIMYGYASIFLLTLLGLRYRVEAQLSENPKVDDTGTFWHVSDFHWDIQYSEHGDPRYMCHLSQNSSGNNDNGYYGNYNCDSPWNLVQSAVSAMRDIEPNPDFIFWTGDNAPHVWNPEPDWTEIFTNLRNISRLLSNTFPNATILPVIGNHDTSPADKMPPNNESIYQAYLKRGGWEQLLPNIALSTFLEGGFYSLLVRDGIRVIGLNSVLWYNKNSMVDNITDPSGHFVWLEGELNNSRHTGEKVYLIGHIAPGHSDRGKPGIINPSLYHDEYNEKYSSIISSYNDIIAGQLFGHLHYDTFELFRDENGTVLGSVLLSSSITPWHSSWPPSAGLSVPVNPSLRLFHYQRKDGLLKDYQQYFMNLTLANSLHYGVEVELDEPHDGPRHESKPLEISANATWELLYTFTEAYGVPDVSTESLNQVYKMLKNSDNVFEMYYNYTSAAKDNGPCNATCKQLHLCAIGYINHNNYEHCVQSCLKSLKTFENKMTHKSHNSELKSSDSSEPKGSDGSHFSYVLRSILIGVSALVVLVAVMISAAWWKRWRLLQGPRYTQFP